MSLGCSPGTKEQCPGTHTALLLAPLTTSPGKAMPVKNQLLAPQLRYLHPHSSPQQVLSYLRAEERR